MILIALSVLTIAAISSLYLVQAMKTAQVGYENEAGFHFGDEDRSAMPSQSLSFKTPSAIRRKNRRVVRQGNLVPVS